MDWLGKPFAVSKNKGWSLQKSLSRFPEWCIKRLYPPSIHFHLKKEIAGTPRSSFRRPLALVFAANPMRPDSIKTNVFGALFNRSSHLIHDAADNLKDLAKIPPPNSPARPRLSTPPSPPQPHSTKTETGISPDRPFIFDSRWSPSLSLRCLTLPGPNALDYVGRLFVRFSQFGVAKLAKWGFRPDWRSF